jgi:hypothetical protein
MLSSVRVKFYGVSDGPSQVYSAEISDNQYEHQIAVVKFRDWGLMYDNIEPGTPATITYGLTEKKTMYGYVHHIKGDRSPSDSFTEVTFIGASFVMKQQRQETYSDITADQIIAQIAKRHNFIAYTTPHNRVYPMVSQAGHSDWELMVQLAKQCGYMLRTNNTELYFQPMLEEYERNRLSAPKFTLRGQDKPYGWSIYKFSPIVGETISFDGTAKAAIAVAGVDRVNKSPMRIAKQKANKKTRRITTPEFFDIFATNVVATDHETAQFEARAADDRNSFPYRAEVEVIGTTSVRPGMPVYLEGVGTPYTGYWTVLSVTHRFIEKERHRHLYTTEMVVGSDSLGRAGSWTDNKTIVAPTETPVRTVIPNVRQTVRKPSTLLANGQSRLPKKVKTPFGTTVNRSAPPSKINAAPVTWKSDTKKAVSTDRGPSRSYHVVARLQKKGLL